MFFFYRIIKSETLEKTGNRLLLVFERHPCINALRAGRDGQTILLIIIVIIIIIIVIIIIIITTTLFKCVNLKDFVSSVFSS